MAELIFRRLGINANLVEGDTGEFTIWVNGRMVAKKGLIRFPSDQKVLAAVEQALAT